MVLVGRLTVTIYDSECPDCGAEIGSRHRPGCDIERCPRCGRQAISCACIYEVCGLDQNTLETDAPEIFHHGPTPEMTATWEREWGARAIPWSGLWPGIKECQEYGLYAKLVPGRGWVPCAPSDPEASEDLNTLVTRGKWDVDTQRWVIPS